jgi:hypothetical protein
MSPRGFYGKRGRNSPFFFSSAHPLVVTFLLGFVFRGRLCKNKIMEKPREIIKAFKHGVTRSRVSMIGALLTTAVTPLLLGLIIVDSLEQIDNPYLGGFIYLLLGPLFIAGLLMVFIGVVFLKGKEEVGIFSYDYLKEHFTDPARFARVRKLFFLGVFLTGVNIFIIVLLSYEGYRYMESNTFCGEFCHTVMEPEYTAFQNSPHSRVKCVECHIGEGATWFVKSKLSGARQLFATALETYPRPIPTPVEELRPARETCAQCHRPDLFHGDRLDVIDSFLPDEENTHVQTVIIMRIGSAGGLTEEPHDIHWHVAEENTIIYLHTDYERMQIPEVTLIRPDGTRTVYRSAAAQAGNEEGSLREMDCIDCHNRPTHIYLTPERALDNKMIGGRIPRQLPYIKREALEAITRPYATSEEAMAGIGNYLQTWYETHYPEVLTKNPELLATAISGAREAYAENVFPRMNVTWNTYPNHLGHANFEFGCFRCHGGEHFTEEGEMITADCNACHIILALEEEDPEILRQLDLR